MIFILYIFSDKSPIRINVKIFFFFLMVVFLLQGANNICGYRHYSPAAFNDSKKKKKTFLEFTCIIVLSSVRKVHCATTGKAWHTSISERGGLVFLTTVVRMSMDVCGADRKKVVRFCYESQGKKR